MAVLRDRITVVPPDGETVVVDIKSGGVSLGTAHAERTTSRTLTLPLSITSQTSFFVPQGGTYTVSVKLNDTEIAGPGETPVVVSSFPAVVRATVDSSELRDVSGGSAAVVRAFPFAYNTAGLVTGHTVYTPTAGDVLLDAWFQVDTAWNGTDAQADFGTFKSGGSPSTVGMFALTFRGPVLIGNLAVDSSFQDDAFTLGNSLSSLRDVATLDQVINVLKAPPVASTPQGETAFVLYDGASPYSPTLPDSHGNRVLPALLTGEPIKVVVSQNGQAGGLSPGATAGAAVLYLVTATPAAA